MNNDDNFLAYFKFSGDRVKDGYLDAQKSAEALISIDEMFRYFLYKNDPKLNKVDFELPVRIRKGSWETLIPENIGDILKIFVTTGLSAYGISAMQKLAQNDINDKGFKDVFKNIVKSIKWIIQIGKHTKTLDKKSFENIRFKEKNNIKFIGISNDNNEILYVPKKYLEIYSEVPGTLLSRIASLVEDERILKIGFSRKESYDLDDTDEEVTITTNEKKIFYKKADENEVLFPELKHNQYVELLGHITRGNENTDTLGFAYNNHILTCYPQQGSILKYRSLFFSDCIIKGYIDRIDKNNNFIEKKPKIRYLEIVKNDSNKEDDLFN